MRRIAFLLPLLAVLFAALSAAACEPAVEPDKTPAPIQWATPTPGGSATAANLPACEWAKVISVHDGDTIRVSIDGGPYERLRYIGIDAPEVESSTSTAEPFGDDATELNRKLVEGKEICLEKDVSDVDQYGRLLRYAWLPDGRMVEEEILRAGMARVVTFKPDTKYQKSRLNAVEAEAREKELGIWSR